MIVGDEKCNPDNQEEIIHGVLNAVGRPLYIYCPFCRFYVDQAVRDIEYLCYGNYIYLYIDIAEKGAFNYITVRRDYKKIYDL